eukprot:4314265-Pleurochrysis_carterae.AAC.3
MAERAARRNEQRRAQFAPIDHNTALLPTKASREPPHSAPPRLLIRFAQSPSGCLSSVTERSTSASVGADASWASGA